LWAGSLSTCCQARRRSRSAYSVRRHVRRPWRPWLCAAVSISLDCLPRVPVQEGAQRCEGHATASQPAGTHRGGAGRRSSRGGGPQGGPPPLAPPSSAALEAAPPPGTCTASATPWHRWRGTKRWEQGKSGLRRSPTPLPAQLQPQKPAWLDSCARQLTRSSLPLREITSFRTSIEPSTLYNLTAQGWQFNSALDWQRSRQKKHCIGN